MEDSTIFNQEITEGILQEIQGKIDTLREGFTRENVWEN